MKKIISLLLLAGLSFASCDKQDSLDPRPIDVGGQYVRLDITNKMLASEHIDETYFGGFLSTPANNVEKYVLKVRRRNPNSVITGNYVELLTVTSFPTELKITPQMIADAIGIPVTSLEVGDYYVFFGEAYGFDGKVTNYNNLSSTVKTQPGMKQAFRFVTTLATDANINILNDTFNNYQLGL